MTILKQGVQLDVELQLPVQKLWEALRDIDNVAPKIAVKLTHKVLKGNGGVGSVSLVQFDDGRLERERVDAVDDRTHTLVSTVISQEAAKGYNKYTKTMALSSARNGTTTIARWRAEYAPLGEGAGPMKLASDNALIMFKALETYLTSVQELTV